MPAKGLLVRFYFDAVHLDHLSKKEGRPIFEDREHVQIIPIGDTKTVVVREALQSDRERFPEEYAAFKKGETMRPVGTLLNEWPILRPAQIKMLEFLNIYTVEQLAEIDDLAKQRIGMGANEMVIQAKAYIAKAKDQGFSQAQAAENERLKSEIAQLRDQMDRMSEMIQGQGETEKRGAGRKQAAA